jgi:hypothetical protein
MAIIVTGSALVIVVLVIPLVIMRTGIRRQERHRCLACQPPGLAASLTRRLIGLSVSRPAPSACHPLHSCETEGESVLVADETNSPGMR